MEIKNSHAVPHGPSLIDKIRDELDLAYEIWDDRIKMDSQMHKKMKDSNSREHCQMCFDALGDQYYAQGIALALGILRSSSENEEWRLAEERFNA